MAHLFTYGTLMHPQIMAEVSGCRLQGTAAVLHGFRRHPVRGEDYPGIVPEGGALTEGVVYRDVPTPAWERLDRFEGEMYARQRVVVAIDQDRELEAEAYVVRPAFRELLEDGPWDFQRFRREGKTRFQQRYKGYRDI